MFAKGAKPKTISTQEAPIVTEEAPKIANTSSEEVVVGVKEMHFWRDLEKQQIIATILESFTRHKNQASLERMSRPSLLKSVEGRLGTAKKQQVGPRNRMVKVGARPINV